MNVQQPALTKLKGRLARPSTWLAALALSATVLVAKPTFDDWQLRQSPTAVATMHSSSQAFFDFDWGAIWDGISSSIMGWFNEMQGVQQAAVASKEKQDAAEQQLKQSDLNSDAAEDVSQAAIAAQDTFGGERIDACQVMEENKQNIETAGDSLKEARAMTQVFASNKNHVPNAVKVIAQRLAKAYGDYCSPESLERGRCPGGAVSPKNMPDADIHAMSIMGTSSDTTQTLSPDEHDAAVAYVQWSTDPVPDEDLPVGMERTEAGQRYMLEKRRRAAITSAAQYAMNKIVAARWVKN